MPISYLTLPPLEYLSGPAVGVINKKRELDVSDTEEQQENKRRGDPEKKQVHWNLSPMLPARYLYSDLLVREVPLPEPVNWYAPGVGYHVPPKRRGSTSCWSTDSMFSHTTQACDGPCDRAVTTSGSDLSFSASQGHSLSPPWRPAPPRPASQSGPRSDPQDPPSRCWCEAVERQDVNANEDESNEPNGTGPRPGDAVQRPADIAANNPPEIQVNESAAAIPIGRLTKQDEGYNSPPPPYPTEGHNPPNPAVYEAAVKPALLADTSLNCPVEQGLRHRFPAPPLEGHIPPEAPAHRLSAACLEPPAMTANSAFGRKLPTLEWQSGPFWRPMPWAPFTDPPLPAVGVTDDDHDETLTLAAHETRHVW
ncbi:uncharacterized protein Z519_05710 [Cladophialophora bantiana CBS 173.52]|uniref:Uncharacterized protein n=1 Tax=Cladophialophora bantiana (strain ATCC 10958 / CBS 173.52 / CDC B-1940 / NIH 8579) TaxID=1442370 RepID=A0A0D2HQK5_CLAB1|nr:uncharacterized protein Z519_05710 [Cladophialophora bantiana CBS 173.52]KIW93105.1 hypothetical protein Z519_05710 [Cladophialophora bantiana CBS 173.52]